MHKPRFWVSQEMERAPHPHLHLPLTTSNMCCFYVVPSQFSATQRFMKQMCQYRCQYNTSQYIRIPLSSLPDSTLSPKQFTQDMFLYPRGIHTPSFSPRSVCYTRWQKFYCHQVNSCPPNPTPAPGIRHMPKELVTKPQSVRGPGLSIPARKRAPKLHEPPTAFPRPGRENGHTAAARQ